jgi:hypothetical protein
LVAPERCEVARGAHRVDILGLQDTPILLRQKPVSEPRVEETERFFARMLWLIDATRFRDRLSIRPRSEGRSHSASTAVLVDWPRRRRSFERIRQLLYWDLGSGDMLRIDGMCADPIRATYGTQKQFAKRWLGEDAAERALRGARARHLPVAEHQAPVTTVADQRTSIGAAMGREPSGTRAAPQTNRATDLAVINKVSEAEILERGTADFLSWTTWVEDVAELSSARRAAVWEGLGEGPAADAARREWTRRRGDGG